MIRLTWALCEGWIAGYLFAGPPRRALSPIEEMTLATADLQRFTEAMRRFVPTVAEASRAFADFSVAYREAMDAADDPTTSCQA